MFSLLDLTAILLTLSALFGWEMLNFTKSGGSIDHLNDFFVLRINDQEPVPQQRVVIRLEARHMRGSFGWQHVRYNVCGQRSTDRSGKVRGRDLDDAVPADVIPDLLSLRRRQEKTAIGHRLTRRRRCFLYRLTAGSAGR